jgi:hypothetical protein
MCHLSVKYAKSEGRVATAAVVAIEVTALPAVKAAPDVAAPVEDPEAGDPVDPADRAEAIAARVGHVASRMPTMTIATGMTQAVVD